MGRMLVRALVLGLVGLAAAPTCVRAASEAAGEALYADNCAPCHGEGLRNPGSSFDLKQLGRAERARFNGSVLGGKGQMPPWKGTLSDADLDDLWAYIRLNAD